MCGIVGYTGINQALPILMDGLEKLEYRGYDSAGVYMNDGVEEDLVREVGRVKDLEAVVDKMEIKGTAGIAHTRWATHGKPTVNNAHPHKSNDGRYYLVHNGVIENFKELREEYLSDIEMHSDTDTEVAVQLIGKFAQEGFSTFDALRLMLSKLDENSAYGFLLVDSKEPDMMYVAKSKSPLLIGLSEDGNVVASDATAVLNVTNTFLELHDGDIAVVEKDKVTLFDKDGKQFEREPFILDIDPSQAEKGTYPFYMLKEIDEQAIVTRNLIEHYFIDGMPQIDQPIVDAIKYADRLYIVAAGTSYHAGLQGRRMFEELVGIPTEVHISSEFAYDMPLLSKKPFFIFLSQSGETADSREVLERVNKLGYKSLTIANVMNSTLTREATFSLPLLAGPEVSVASTKAFTSQIVVEMILASAIAGGQTELQDQLSKLAVDMQVVIDAKDKLKEIADKYLLNAKNAFYIGRGADADLTVEAALKLKEISYVQAEGFAAGELKHGTISLIEDGTPVFAIITNKSTAGLTRSNLMETEARGAKAFTIVTSDLAKSGDDIVIPAVENPLLSPLLAVIPTQLLAYYTSLGKGFDVDHPRNLAKSVTVQ
ncbi:MAG: glutamine--fructose-6-phosphate transaminase (isomerizing) [Lactobacillaceae bacterium]|jgi:glucosamine--fructose-6-phosphate aminotransferase (isomerizing)|nr:glutamine--fructose-6-phosphate transaminase (isomerizing) [Lactobacillaceae bacterium]